jgi:hypothetical protein
MRACVRACVRASVHDFEKVSGVLIKVSCVVSFLSYVFVVAGSNPTLAFLGCSF